LFSVLEGLKSFPASPAELKSWWVEELGAKPIKPKAKEGKGDIADDDEEVSDADADDWRRFFDEDDSGKRDAGASKVPATRLHKLTVHQSLHTLPSHRALFTRQWLALLPRLTMLEGPNRGLSIRALNMMHRDVMPHLTRAVMIMDWVGGCVDHGGWYASSMSFSHL